MVDRAQHATRVRRRVPAAPDAAGVHRAGRGRLVEPAAAAPGAGARHRRPARPRADQGLPAGHPGKHPRTARQRRRDRRRPLLLPSRAVSRRHARRAVRGDGADAGSAPGRRAGAHRRHARAAAAAGHALGAGHARKRLRLRAGARGAPGGRARIRDRRPARHLEPVRRIRRGRRLRPRGALAWRRLALALRTDRGPARAAPCRADRRGAQRHGRLGAAAAIWRHRARGRPPQRRAPELVGGRRLGALGRPARGDRGRMGDRRPYGGAPRLPLGRRARVDFGHLQPWPGYRADPWSAGTEFDPAAAFGRARVLRGASFATRARLRSLRRRGFALPERDDGFFGFRTCAL